MIHKLPPIYLIFLFCFIANNLYSQNLDIVNGTLAGAKLFGHAARIRGNHDMDIEQLVVGFESTFSTVLYFLCTFLAIFATAHLVPRLQEKGTIDLYLSGELIEGPQAEQHYREKLVRLPGTGVCTESSGFSFCPPFPVGARRRQAMTLPNESKRIVGGTGQDSGERSERTRRAES